MIKVIVAHEYNTLFSSKQAWPQDEHGCNIMFISMCNPHTDTMDEQQCRHFQRPNEEGHKI